MCLHGRMGQGHGGGGQKQVCRAKPVSVQYKVEICLKRASNSYSSQFPRTSGSNLHIHCTPSRHRWENQRCPFHKISPVRPCMCVCSLSQARDDDLRSLNPLLLSFSLGGMVALSIVSLYGPDGRHVDMIKYLFQIFFYLQHMFGNNQTTQKLSIQNQMA